MDLELFDKIKDEIDNLDKLFLQLENLQILNNQKFDEELEQLEEKIKKSSKKLHILKDEISKH